MPSSSSPSDEEELQAALRTLNVGADPLHADRTPAVEALGRMGLRAVPALLDRLVDENEMTRLRAQRALELVLSRRHGFIPGRGFPSPACEAAMRAEWQTNGDYHYDAPATVRCAAVERWRAWLNTAREPA
jgi:hypothetical protein